MGMEWLKAVDALWPVFLAILGQFGVYIKLLQRVSTLEEGLQNANDALKEHKEKTDERMEKNMRVIWEKMDKMHESLTKVLQSVSHIEGQLDREKRQ